MIDKDATIDNLLAELQLKTEAREKEKTCFSRDLPVSKYTYIVDTRESNPYYFASSYKHCLSEGDYTISSYEGLVVIERKEFSDYINSLVHNRERFLNELERLKKYEAKCIIVEDLYSSILNGSYRSQVHPNALQSMSHSASFRFDIPVFFVESYALGNRFTQFYLQTFARKKEINFSSFASKSPLGLEPEQTIISLSLESFISAITLQKERFKQQIAELKHYRSSAIILECKYSDILQRRYKAKIEPTTIESIIFSLIIDYEIPVYFLESKEISLKWQQAHLKRYLPTPLKEPKQRKPKIEKRKSNV